MDSQKTIFGVRARQMAVWAIAVVLPITAPRALAAPSPSAAVANDQLLLIQGQGVMEPAPAPRLHSGFPAAATGIYSSVSGNILLWPGTVSYTRAVEWVKPYLQPDLHLGVDYTYQFNFMLRGRDSASAVQAVPDGWYELDMAVVLPEIKTAYLKAAGISRKLNPYDRFITSRSLLIQVSGGVANRRITLRYPNLSATTIANHLYVSLTPLQMNCTRPRYETAVPCIQTDAHGQPDLKNSTIRPLDGYKSYLLDIPFVPYAPAGSGTSNPDDAPPSPNPAADANLAEYIARARTYQAAKSGGRSAPISAKAFADTNLLNYVSWNDPSLSRSLEQWHPHGEIHVNVRPLLQRLFAQNSLGTVELKDGGYDQLWQALCATLVNFNRKVMNDLKSDRPTYDRNNIRAMIGMCGRYPDKALRLTLTDHIYRFDSSKVEIEAMQPLRFMMQTGFMVSRSHSQDSFYSFNPLELPFKVFDAFGIPLRALGLNHSVNSSDGRSENESSGGSVMLGLDFNLMPLRIPVTRAQRCLEVKPLSQPLLPFFDETAPTRSRNGLYICADVSNQPRVAGEIFAHIFVHGGDTSLVDSYNPLAQSVNVALQGDRDISTFFQLTRQALTPDHDSRVLPTQMLDGARDYFAHTPTSQPGVIVRPVQFYREKVPSFVGMVFGTYKENFIGQNR
jgi:hypothetical protein